MNAGAADPGAGSSDPGAGAADPGAGSSDPAAALLELYDRSLPRVYGYLLSRCGQVHLAEDLTAQTFLAAVGAVRRDPATSLSSPWLLAVARNKLVDHWRRKAREERGLEEVAAADPAATDPAGAAGAEDPWDERLDAMRSRAVLAELSPHHRAALVLRYLDDLPVPEVAALLDRTVHATEGLLVRARAAFRRAYTAEVSDA